MAMDDQAAVERPALLGLLHDLVELLLGHSGIMLQRHPPNGFACGEIPDQTGEGYHGADAGIIATQPLQLGGRIEIFALDPDGHDQPPVTGGNSATSSLAATGSAARA